MLHTVWSRSMPDVVMVDTSDDDTAKWAWVFQVDPDLASAQIDHYEAFTEDLIDFLRVWADLVVVEGEAIPPPLDAKGRRHGIHLVKGKATHGLTLPGGTRMRQCRGEVREEQPPLPEFEHLPIIVNVIPVAPPRPESTPAAGRDARETRKA